MRYDRVAAEEFQPRESATDNTVMKTPVSVGKRILKIVVSFVFYSGSRARRGLQRIMGRKLPGTCVVLYYHAVPAALRGRFAGQMDVLKRCAKPVRSDLQEPLENGVHHAVVTFHDAFVSVSDNAVPELARRGIPATIFAPSGYLGERPQWIKDERHSDFGELILDAKGLRSLESELVSIGSHTVSHPSLPTLSGDRAREELRKSKNDLETILGRPVELFAFPYGDYNEELVGWTKQVGYRRVFTIEPNLAFSNPKEYVTGSCLVSPKDWGVEFRLKVLGAYRWSVPLQAFRRKIGHRFRKVSVPSARPQQEKI